MSIEGAHLSRHRLRRAGDGAISQKPCSLPQFGPETHEPDLELDSGSSVLQRLQALKPLIAAGADLAEEEAEEDAKEEAAEDGASDGQDGEAALADDLDQPDASCPGSSGEADPAAAAVSPAAAKKVPHPPNRTACFSMPTMSAPGIFLHRSD